MYKIKKQYILAGKKVVDLKYHKLTAKLKLQAIKIWQKGWKDHPMGNMNFVCTLTKEGKPKKIITQSADVSGELSKLLSIG